MGMTYSMHGELRIHTKYLEENLKGGNHLEDLGIDDRITVK
jgi:hypothetical protein